MYKDLVSDPGNGIQPTSSTWAKKHIFGWSDEEIRLDLQQQRIERAVGEELKATPTVISKTGIFDNIDKLYGNAGKPAAPGQTPPEGTDATLGGGFGGESPSPPAGGEEPLPPAGGEAPEAGGGTEITPESKQKNMNLLIESNLLEGSKILDLGQAQDSLGEISKELDKLLNS